MCHVLAERDLCNNRFLNTTGIKGYDHIGNEPQHWIELAKVL